VKHKIGSTVKHDTYTYTQQVAVWIYHAKINKQYARGGKNNGKYIVPFNLAAIAYVVVLMKSPHKAMHYVFMCKPGHKFHEEKGQNY
jgi:hypothetical protein